MYKAELDYESKFKIMKEYVDKTGEKIKTTTKYNGYNIGSWQQNIRTRYRNGRLHISEELLRKLEKIQVIAERERTPKTSDKEKYQLFINFKKEFPNEPITPNLVDSKNNPLSMYRSCLQHKYNIKELDLSEEEIIELKKLRILNLNSREIKKLKLEYNLTEKQLNEIVHEYGTVNEFFKNYKLGNVDKSKFRHIFNKKTGIVISRKEISEAEKQKYLSLIAKVFNNNEIDNPKKFVFKEDINQVLMLFSEKDRYIINSRFGINGEEQKRLVDLAEEFNVCKQSIRNVEAKVFKKICKHVTIYSIEELVKEKENLEKELQRLPTLEYQEKYQSLLDSYDIEKLKLNQRLFNVLKRDGINNIGELRNASRLRLTCVPYIKQTNIEEIQEKLNEFMSQHSILDIIYKYSNKITILDTFINVYNKAYEYYINDEKIWDDSEKIPGLEMDERSIEKRVIKLEEKEEIVQATPIEELQIDGHTYLALTRNGIITIEQLQTFSRSELESLQTCGKTKIREIATKLSKYENIKYRNSVLDKKRKERLQKQESLSFLDELIDEQDNKTKNLEDILKVKGEI